jgi:hypothetical protein
MKSKLILAFLIIIPIDVNVSATVIKIPDDYPSIQTGIDSSRSGDTVLVQPGEYYENITIFQKPMTLASLYMTTGDSMMIYNTVINGNWSGSVIRIDSCHASKTFLIGFTIKNGSALEGGGIYCRDSNLRILHNIIKDNIVTSTLDSCGYGAGIYFRNNSTWHYRQNIVEGNWITRNTANGYHYKEGYGGGIYCSNTDAIINNNIIDENNASGIASGGAGINLRSSDATITGNIVTGNVCEVGAGIYCMWGSSPYIAHNLIYSNIGGGVSGVGTRYPDIRNNIIVDNTEAGGLMFSGYSYPTFINNIIRNNQDFEVYVDGPGRAFAVYNNILGGHDGEGNIDIEPLFRDPQNGDYHLMSTACGDPYDSPCIDMGHPAIRDSLVDCDWGLGRFNSDMGAYGGGDSVVVGIGWDEPENPLQTGLLCAYPNPFNAATTISFTLTEPQMVRLDIYNMLGQRVISLIDQDLAAGEHSPIWLAGDCPSGVYFARLCYGDINYSIKMILLK